MSSWLSGRGTAIQDMEGPPELQVWVVRPVEKTLTLGRIWGSRSRLVHTSPLPSEEYAQSASHPWSGQCSANTDLGLSILGTF